ncbi:MAG: hypothetical protein MUP55_00930 [Candidatus Aenigmarchaeota archaeon]|nr:hypothetical protein [Candidatus Aenigmarchaeota archaeon]
MVTYHQGNGKIIVNDLTKYYMFRDIISKNYDKLGLMEQESVLENFSQRHKISKKLISEDDARNALQEHFDEMSEPRLRAIYNNIMGPKPKSCKLKEKAQENSGKTREPCCKAEQFNLFGE